MTLSRWLATLIGIAVTGAPNAGQPTLPKNEHAVVVHFSYGSKDLTKLFALEDKLEKAITAASVGEYDGNEVNVDGSDGYLYMYGPNADKLFTVVKPILESTPFMRGAKAKLHYGPPQGGYPEKIIAIGP